MDFSSLTPAEKQKLLGALVKSMVEDSVAEVMATIAVEPEPQLPDPLPLDPQPEPTPDPEPEVVEPELTPPPVPETPNVPELSDLPELHIENNNNTLTITVNAGKGNHKVQGMVIKQGNDYGTTLTEWKPVKHNGVYVYKFEGDVFVKMYTQFENGKWHNAFDTIVDANAPKVDPVPEIKPPLVPSKPAPKPHSTPGIKKDGKSRLGINSTWLYNLDQEPNNMYEEGSLNIKPAFIEDMKPMAHFRWMNINQVNNSDVDGSNWLLEPNDIMNRQVGGWGQDPYAKGMAIEEICRISNLTQTEPWINFPHRCHETPAIYAHVAAIVKEHLDPHLNAIFEFSNENWNSGASFAKATIYAAELSTWPGQKTGNNRWGKWGSPDHARHGNVMATKVMADKIKPILGDRAVIAAMSQRPTGCQNVHLKAIKDVGLRPDVFGIAPYMSGAAITPAGGRAQLPELEGYMQNARKIADELGTLFYSYEGGAEGWAKHARDSWDTLDGEQVTYEWASMCLKYCDRLTMYRYAAKDFFGTSLYVGDRSATASRFKGFIKAGEEAK